MTDAHRAGDGRAGEAATVQQSTGFKAALFTWHTGTLPWSP
jgi:hypothetical protein